MNKHLREKEYVANLPLRIVWLERLSIHTLLRVFGLFLKERNIEVRFLRSSLFPMLLQAILPFKVSKVQDSLADLWEGGQSLGMRAQAELPKMVLRTVQKLSEQKRYKRLCTLLPKEKVDVLFSSKVYEELRMLVRLRLLAKWAERHKEGLLQQTILYPDNGLLSAVTEIWRDKDIALVPYQEISIRYLKKMIRASDLYSRKVLLGTAKNRSEISDRDSSAKIGVHYTEGVDHRKRTDLYWYADSGIDPSRVVIYIDAVKASRGPISGAELEAIDKIGMLWVALRKNLVANPERYRWKKIKYKGKLRSEYSRFIDLKCGSKLDKWIYMTGKNLLKDIKYWEAFYGHFNVKVAIDFVSWTGETIAQNMALEKLGGFKAGTQRSIMSLKESLPFLAYNSNHIFFIWNNSAIRHKGTSRVIEKFIIAGYPFDIVHKRHLEDSLQRKIEKLKGKFIIALFDSSFAEDSYVSKRMVERFYQGFLSWLLEDEGIAIITKEKKKVFFDQLTGINELVERAERTDRFVRLKDTLGRLPIDASACADMAIGLAVSSAVVETVLTGRRGVHCDLSGHVNHHFYDWGKGRIIFDNLEMLIEEIRAYRTDISKNKELGDWSPYYKELDPFRDAGTGSRVGSYLKHLLEALDKGRTREEAGEQADKLYRQRWGNDKIVSMQRKTVSIESQSDL
ncbi:MAG: hypothetical protein GF409_04905 [Candidatus Omnitrophica bacterium]|nr:hypothetical protein [Candidatus Omnitrophota bacterium]